MVSKPAVPAAQGLQLQSSNSTVEQVNNSSRKGSPAPVGAGSPQGLTWALMQGLLKALARTQRLWGLLCTKEEWCCCIILWALPLCRESIVELSKGMQTRSIVLQRPV